jgi:protein arginine kinase activator
MKCQLCQAGEAGVHIKQVQDGKPQDLFVCNECAAKQGFEGLSVMSMTDFLFGVGIAGEARAAPEERRCVCGMTSRDLKKNSRMGCARCYETFAVEMKPILLSMQPGDRHVGKIPASAKAVAEDALMRQELAQAVAEQDFELAARIRDSLRELDGAMKKEATSKGAVT